MQEARYEGAVNGGCLLCMPALDAGEYRDAMASLLYMQLAARKKHSPLFDPHKWYEVFSSGLQRFGWVPLTHGYSQSTLKDKFTLAQLAAKEWGMPRTPPQLAAWEQLCTQMAKRPETDSVLSLLQHHSIGTLSADDGDAAEGDDTPAPVEPTSPASSVTVPEAAARAGHKPVATAPPRTAITVQFGLMLPGRRLQLLFLHFNTREQAQKNLFTQTFAAKQVVGGVHVKSFFGELSELRYANVRDRFNGLLHNHWAKEVAEHLPLGDKA